MVGTSKEHSKFNFAIAGSNCSNGEWRVQNYQNRAASRIMEIEVDDGS